ncbi:hypothetical protein CCUS01_00398 [Colletotrichum cuscutae]|uniref:Uncharacterized protein n=1 Tax=Colletotrichum cuscutae TaxID=1209917 RepID=A0AAI9VG11_9PEZI|nr:hypothetical protein CCUS01_00398 [Colletotrichum cuscutae]
MRPNVDNSTEFSRFLDSLTLNTTIYFVRRLNAFLYAVRDGRPTHTLLGDVPPSGAGEHGPSVWDPASFVFIRANQGGRRPKLPSSLRMTSSLSTRISAASRSVYPSTPLLVEIEREKVRKILWFRVRNYRDFESHAVPFLE